MNTSIAELVKFSSPEELRKAWDELKKMHSGIRIRDAAYKLGVSEAELLATEVGRSAVRLAGNWQDFLKRLPELGRVMSLTRNDACVLENKGSFQKIETFGEGERAMGTVIGPIETRVFFSGWHVGFSLNQDTPRGPLQSLQIFDKTGTAVTKIFLQEKSNTEAFTRITEDFRADDQSSIYETESYLPTVYLEKEDIDRQSLVEDWSNMKDTHDFFGMLRKHRVNRCDALELTEGIFTQRIDASCLQQVLEKAASSKLPIMVFAGNRGNLQIHQGKVMTIRPMDRWLNILDPDFNMHLRTDLIDSAWLVRKPTSDGVVTSIELFDSKKELIAQFFGLRKPGIPELEDWRVLLNEVIVKPSEN